MRSELEKHVELGFLRGEGRGSVLMQCVYFMACFGGVIVGYMFGGF
jgi:hypothetical protein